MDGNKSPPDLNETILPELSFDDLLSADEATPTKKTAFLTTKDTISPSTSLTSSPETSAAKGKISVPIVKTFSNGNTIISSVPAVAPTTSLAKDSKPFVLTGIKPIMTTVKSGMTSGTMITTLTTEEGMKKVANLVKIAPKPLGPGTTLKSPTSGKIYLFSGPNGNKVPVRIANTLATSAGKVTTTTGKPVIPVIRNAAGNIVQLKPAKNINIANLQQLTGKKIITTSGGSSILIKNPVSGIKTIPSNQIIKTISLADGQKKIQKIIPASSINSPGGSGVLTVSASKVGTPQLVKLSPHVQGQIQTVHMPSAKPGVPGGYQLVRILNAPGGLTQKTIDGTTRFEAPTRFTVLKQNPAASKIIVTSPKQHFLPKTTMTTVPQLRKISEIPGAKFLSVVKKEPIEEVVAVNPAKITELNNEIKRLSSSEHPTTFASSTEMPSTSSTTGKKIIVMPQTLFRQHDARNNNKQHIGFKKVREIVAAAQPKKLYTYIEPKTEPVDHDIPPLGNNNVKSEPVSRTVSVSPTLPTEAIRRKHCNCTKSQCLKLYCDCFANGEFCQDCNCKDCFNNLEYEDERQKAIKVCLERNPSAFKPKITTAQSDLRQHNKGCNCKRSSCLKNYCECYEAKIACSSNCKCVGCRNVEDRPDLDLDPVDGSTNNSSQLSLPRLTTLKRTYDEMDSTGSATHNAQCTSHANDQDGLKPQKTNLITPDVVDASVQCMIAQVDECMKNDLPPDQTERLILEELSRCLVEIIDFSIRTGDAN